MGTILVLMTTRQRRSCMSSGHNLNLKHGGSAPTPNCKPNYISVMNYLFQFPTYVPTRAIDYSHSVIPSLSEAQLVENNGIGPSSPVNLPTSVGHIVPPTSHSPHDRDAVANNSPINYNWYTGNNVLGQTVSSSITNFHFSPCNDNTVESLYGYDDVHYNSFIFWASSGPFQNASLIPQLASDVGNPMLSDQLVSNLSNFTTIETNFSILNNQLVTNLSNVSSLTPFIAGTTNDILKDPKLPPCDVTVTGCVDSPCDPGDAACTAIQNHTYTNPNMGLIDVGEKVNLTEVTAFDVVNAIKSKVLDINGLLQSMNQSKFVNGTDVTKLKNDLQTSLVNGSNSVYSLINSSKSDEGLDKIHKLRSLIDGRQSTFQILNYPNNVEILNLVDDLRIALEKRK